MVRWLRNLLGIRAVQRDVRSEAEEVQAGLRVREWNHHRGEGPVYWGRPGKTLTLEVTTPGTGCTVCIPVRQQAEPYIEGKVFQLVRGQWVQVRDTRGAPGVGGGVEK